MGSADRIRRRAFLSSSALASAGLLVPEWLLYPPKGRSMVSVPRPFYPNVRHWSADDRGPFVDFYAYYDDGSHDGPFRVYEREGGAA